MPKVTRRSGRSNWELQVPVPNKLRSILKTASVYRSTGTSNKREANRIAPILALEVQAQFNDLLVRHFPDDEVLLNELMEYYRAWRVADDLGEEDEVTEKEVLTDIIIDFPKQAARRVFLASKGEMDLEGRKALQAHTEKVLEDARDRLLDRRQLIEEVVDSWRTSVKPSLSQSTQEEYERAIKRYLEWAEGRLVYVEEVKRQDVRLFIEECYHGRKKATVGNVRTALRSVWDHGQDVGLIADDATDPWKAPKHAPSRVGGGVNDDAEEGEDEVLPFTPEDLLIIMNEMEPKEYALAFALSYITGARSNELIRLMKEDVRKEEDGYWIYIRRSKTQSGVRRVPVPERFDTFIESLLNTKPRFKYMLPLYVDKNDWKDERARYRYINKRLNEKRRKLTTIPDNEAKGVHSARRTYTEMCEGTGIPLTTVQLLVGHKRGNITFGRYSKGMLVDLRAAVEKLDWSDEVVALLT